MVEEGVYIPIEELENYEQLEKKLNELKITYSELEEKYKKLESEHGNCVKEAERSKQSVEKVDAEKEDEKEIPETLEEQPLEKKVKKVEVPKKNKKPANKPVKKNSSYPWYKIIDRKDLE